MHTNLHHIMCNAAKYVIVVQCPLPACFSSCLNNGFCHHNLSLDSAAYLENCQGGTPRGRTYLLQGRPVGRAPPVPKEQHGTSRTFLLSFFWELTFEQHFVNLVLEYNALKRHRTPSAPSIIRPIESAVVQKFLHRWWRLGGGHLRRPGGHVPMSLLKNASDQILDIGIIIL